MASRLATTVYYIEDTDSLRFALSVYDEYDVAALQPHFPGYPVFWAAAKPLYMLTGSFAVAFSLLGGIAAFVIAVVLLRLAGAEPGRMDGWVVAVLVVFNPLFWLTGNRYMPDLAGLAVALGALYLLTAEPRDHPQGRRPWRDVGYVLTGLLAGLRLSYVPFVLVPAAAAFAVERGKLRRAVALAAGTLVWLVPMVLDTGLHDLIAAAGRQAEGHFIEFGGTVQTDPDLVVRLVRSIEAVWADGMGAYWWTRHPLTVLVGLGLVAALAAGAGPFRDRLRADRTWRIHVAAWLIYGVWMLLVQNVIYKSRHALPLLPLIILIAALGTVRLLRSPRWSVRIGALMFLAGYAAVAVILAVQHTQPTAIAQAKSYVDSRLERGDAVLSIPLVNYYLSAQGVEATYISVDDTSASRRLQSQPGRVFEIGSYPYLQAANPTAGDTFYHNPYVNRMWPEVQVHIYEPRPDSISDGR